MEQPIQILNCMIVDDEPLAREVLNRHISRVSSLRVIAECANAIQAIPLLQQKEIDLLFVDIQMPELLGTDLIKILKHPPKTIITTAYSDYAMEGYELDVVDYLLKPIQFERFLKAINKAFQQTGISAPASTTLPERMDNKKEAYLYFRTDRKMVKVMLDEIVYVEGMKNYVKIILNKGTLITKTSMVAIEAMLSEDQFVRIHRSYIVAKSKIISVTNESIHIHNVEIPIGKLFRHNVKKLLS